jgi:hypothetical protein
MKRYLLLVAAVAVAALAFPSIASAQSGHFVTGGGNAPSCTDIGTQVTCSGKVAGLGGTTFEITVEATGIANVTCANPGKNEDVPGQRTEVTPTGTTGPRPTPRNGAFVFSLTTGAVTAPAGSCPSAKWTASIVDVQFTTATLTLFEDGVQTDQVTGVPVN